MTLSKDQQREAYRRMLSIRSFEQAAARQIDNGEIPGAVHSSIGQEAAIVGACMALRDTDYITGTHRSHGHPIGKGAKLPPLMAELMGRTTGICKGRGGSMHLADSSVGIIGESAIVGGGIPIATGAGLSAHVRGTDQVSLCFFGDGATNEGSFHESLNMAAIWKLPVIYFCENNLYAATTPLRSSHGQPDVAHRAAGYGMPGVIVDGQDLEAVHAATGAAVARARRGEGPTLIEAKTYRFDEHAIGLFLPSIYRSSEEVDRYKRERDPLALYRQALLAAGHGEAELAALEQSVSRQVDEAVEFARNSPHPDPAEVYEFMYSNPINYPRAERQSS
ncbi:pyruvate dehydrogenase (acetyl-transferring) E1 component subunit alpha [Denitratisoma sp. DHT3]|uniref:thiamine pyrophosphate-dependent dehydrogenase E1 component subunit alpha n=1 Tax=Denitratisoma sp. DHT3 TaxID=1981880 RepID=UPI001198AADF|nr:thiamine pyrophosphate-dependent dehydrogenase E1 component subunit alpha [Denitratisoma sp. DHT3]QDX80535.1 pyruvate dehydrogenase (acetyl-transferring) E1 component subunit alpha [Denitratisoma sp. DHT3]